MSVAPEPIPLSANADGIIRVGKTRVTLDTVVAAFLEGMTPEAIVEQYPSLALEDVYSVIGYYLRHRSEVETYLQQRRSRAEEVRRENESRFDPVGIRARLLARKSEPGQTQ
jgi:uncharacterized protein (DUF433 family)